MSILNTRFDKIFCINLDQRRDRWENSLNEFQKYSLDVERIPGIDGSKINLDFPPNVHKGAIGCAITQLFVLKYAKQLNLNNFVLFEDDIEFHENSNILFSEYLEEVPEDWDMIYFGGQHLYGRNLKRVSEHVFKCEYTLTAHSVAIRNTVFDRFIDSLIDISKPCDMHYAESHKDINAYVFIPHLTWQKRSYSNILNQEVDYTFLKDISYIDF